MSAPELKKVNIGKDRVISYREAGKGPPVVILHGLGGRSESWVPQYEGLSNSNLVIGWDAPGYNLSSEMQENEPEIADYMEVLKRFTDALGLKNFHLVGHSVGTCIAAAFHQSYPEQLLSLTLAEAVIGSGRDPKEKQELLIAARFNEFKKMSPREVAQKKTPNSLSPNASSEIIQAATDFASNVKVKGHLRLFVSLVRVNIFDFVTSLACPAMIIAGSEDKSAPAEFVKQIANAYPGINYHLIEGIGHQIAFEKPEVFVELLREHFKNGESQMQAAE